MDDLLTATQAADYLGVSRQRINQITKEGYGQRVGSVWLFTREELDRWKAQPAKGPGGRPKRAAGSSALGLTQPQGNYHGPEHTPAEHDE